MNWLLDASMQLQLNVRLLRTVKVFVLLCVSVQGSILSQKVGLPMGANLLETTTESCKVTSQPSKSFAMIFLRARESH